MNYDDLVQCIVQELYKKLENSNIELSKIEKKQKKDVVLLWDNNIEDYKELAKEYNVISYNDEVKDCDILIITKLCLTGLTNLALGASNSHEERFILKMLMRGKKVFILEKGLEYKRYKETAPKVLYNKYISFEEEIKSYGIEVIGDISQINFEVQTSYQEVIYEEKKDVQVNDNNSIKLTNKKLISEADLRKPHIGGVKTIFVDKGSIITPLANDFIRIHHLNIERI